MKLTKKQVRVVLIVTMVAVITAVIFVLIYFMHGKETRTASDDVYTSVNVLECKSSNPINAFFNPGVNADVEQIIKVTYKDDKADKISYDYIGTYDTDKAASDDRTLFAIKYDKDLGEKRNKQKDLTVNFSNTGNKTMITMYTDHDNLNDDISKFFFLNQDEYKDVDKLSADTLKKVYQGKGFSCKYIKK